MTMPDSSNSFFNFQRALRDFQRAHDNAGAHIRLGIEQRLRRFSYQATEIVDNAQHMVMAIDTVRCALAVQKAIEASEAPTYALLRKELAGLDFSAIWGVLRALAKEIALYLGGGAVIGGTVGGIAGAFVFGAGAAPGAMGGADLLQG